MLLLTACVKEKAEGGQPPEEEYILEKKGEGTVSGKLTVSRDRGGVRVAITLQGTDPQKRYIAGIYEDASITGGPLTLTLGAIPGNTGKLDTLVKQLNNGILTSYTELVNYNGHLLIREETVDSTVVSGADVGGNELTGNVRNYSLDSVSAAGSKGTFTIAERKNGHTLCTVTLTRTMPQYTYTTRILDGTPAEAPVVAITLGSFDAFRQSLQQNITQKDDQSVIQYKDLSEYNGYVTVVGESISSGSQVVAQGNIGHNAP
ncbi:hypothetical protein CK934_05865 [Chitinophaga sp. MD30]|nr:hypothetical protein CK934_05865 [Chitinophaga sp. MD30]